MHRAKERIGEWLRNGLAALGLIAVGYWMAGNAAVKAASDSGANIGFQLTGVSETSSLLVYHPEAKTVYVYRGATVGSSTIQCSYKFQLGTPGGAIQRTNCPLGSAQ